MGAFSLGWNLFNGQSATVDRPPPIALRLSPFVPAISAALGVAVLGNLGTVRMIYRALQQMAAPGGVIDPANIFQRLAWTAQGLALTIGGQTLPIGRGEWYWNPSA
jgi:hypothetical protein